jgi:hypothetical protein
MADHSMVFELYYGGAWHAAPVLTRDGCEFRRGIKTRGDSDPAEAAVTLDNRLELYSPRSIGSPLYGLIGLNTKARLTVDGGIRMVGEAVKWMPGRPVKGPGWTKLEVAGLLQRIGRGQDPLASPAQRTILPLAPLAYHPLTDGKGAASAADLAGGAALTVQGAPALASVAGPGAGDTSHPELVGTGGYLGGFSGNLPAATTGEWTVEFGYRAVAPAADAKAVVAQWHVTGTYGGVRWLCYIAKIGGTHGVVVVAHHDALTSTAFNETSIPLLDGAWHQVRVTANQDTATQVTVNLYVDGLLTDTTTVSTYTVGNLVTLTLGDYAGDLASLYPFSNVESLSVAHWAAWSDSAPATTFSAFGGYAGELAADRFTRVCGEEDIVATVVGDPAESVAMGPQGRVTLLELYDEIARTDDGSIFETRDDVGLTMRTGDSKLNQVPGATVSYLGQIVPDLEPVQGDEGVRNDVTAVSPAGATRRVQQLTGPRNVQLPADDPQGVGRYSTRIDVNPATDDALADAAGWRVNLGTYAGTWYARVTADLDADPGIAAVAAALDIGDVLALSNLPVDEALDVVEGLVIGIAESVPPKRRTITFYLVPAEPYQVGVLAETSGDPGDFLGHLDTDGSTTVGSTAAGASLIHVETPSGPAWTTDPDDYPMDLIIGGQRVSVSACGPSTTFPGTVSSGWGSDVTGAAFVNSGGAASDYNVGSGVATQSNTSVNVRRTSRIDVGATDQDYTVDVMITQTSASGASITQWVAGRVDTISDCYVARLDVGTTGAVTLSLVKLIAGVQTTIASAVTVAAAHVGSQWWRVHLQIIGTTIRASAWIPSAGGEPPTWQVTATDSSITVGTQIAVMSRLTTGNTNVLPVIFSWDNLSVQLPQTFVVQPDGRQVTYPIAAGSAVNVQQPIILAL